MRRLLALAGIVAVVSLTALSQPAQAQSLAIQNFTGGQSFPDSYFLGFRFTANSNITVTSLGVLSGITQSHNTALYALDGTQLAQVSVLPTDTVAGQWRFADIGPVPLAAGQDYIVAS